MSKDIRITDRMPVSMQVQEVTSVTCHWHDFLEVIWIIRGSAVVCESTMRYPLCEGDIYVVNYNETHKIICDSEPAVIGFLFVDYRYFSKYIPNLKEISFAHYAFSTAPNPDAALVSCRKYMASAYSLLNREDVKPAEVEDMAVPFLKLIVDTFQYIYYVKDKDGNYIDILSQNNLTKKQLERLHRITYYIYMNCGEKLRLDDLANTELYNRFYISHFIKKAFGLSYQETVSLSRAVISERMLLGTDSSLDEIASAVGFSSRGQYCSHFRKWHGMSPTQYRRENREDAPGNVDNIFVMQRAEAEEAIRGSKIGGAVSKIIT
ncbi:MAG: AraC family transcriptional regulator [Clostridiales Family XIII bacterium]|jgi:AraC-like DNA-binding protein|nr:AraC family transcriptional regulator [Clostridiales Family XIII bacterium]